MGHISVTVTQRPPFTNTVAYTTSAVGHFPHRHGVMDIPLTNIPSRLLTLTREKFH